MTAITADERLEEPTPASTWQAVAQCLVRDELLEWPPDVFALTEVILARSEAYRFVFSPPDGVQWPPGRIASWPQAVLETGRQWSAWAEDRRGPVPALVAEEWGVVRERADRPLRRLADRSVGVRRGARRHRQGRPAGRTRTRRSGPPGAAISTRATAGTARQEQH